MVKFSCSEAKILTEAAQRELRRAITQCKGEFILWQRNRGKLPRLAGEAG
ncbi:MAG TPA: hypothetical protein VFG81_20270 [Anaerolineales bacterium]|jgi:hypothetical protein|nr:hypothetical protein [Anaerolineales bacterium]